MTTRLAILVTHPIQYLAPLFRLLAAADGIDLHVFYGWEGAIHETLDRGFGRVIAWDIPLLDGYAHTFLRNDSTDPGTHHFGGISSADPLTPLCTWRPDALLVFGWNYRSHLTVLRKLHGRVPIFFRGDSTLLDETSGPRRVLRRTWLRWVYSHVDVALYVGENNKRYFLAHGLAESRITWAPHSVENERFATDPGGCLERAALEWRRGLGIDDGSVAVLFAGKLESKKAPDLLLQAFLQRSAASQQHLIFVGSGPLEEVLRRRTAGSANVHFLGFQNQSQMPMVYRLGDVFVLPSRGPGETWGLAVNEAMACGRPVIVSDRVGCAPDLVANTGSGVVTEADDVDNLARALDLTTQSTAIRRQMGYAASKEIVRWSLSEQASRIQRSVERFLEKE